MILEFKRQSFKLKQKENVRLQGSKVKQKWSKSERLWHNISYISRRLSNTKIKYVVLWSMVYETGKTISTTIENYTRRMSLCEGRIKFAFPPFVWVLLTLRTLSEAMDHYKSIDLIADYKLWSIDFAFRAIICIFKVRWRSLT